MKSNNDWVLGVLTFSIAIAYESVIMGLLSMILVGIKLNRMGKKRK